MITAHHILEAEKALLVETDDPTALLARVPTAFHLEGRVCGMPHDVESVARLALMGVQVQAPIEKYYRWPRDRSLWPQPFAHQIPTAAFMTSNPHCYVLNDIGTSKTGTALWAADYLMETKHVRRVLIVAPISTLERVWGDTLFIHFTHRTFAVLHGSAERRRKLLAQPKDFYIVNPDGAIVIQKELAARKDIDMIIIDELAKYRKKNTGIWKALDSIVYPDKGRPIPWVWGLTGKPIPNSPEDAFSQCLLVTPTTVPKFFSQFRAMVMDHQSTYIWTPRPEATKVVYDVMRPAIRYKRDDCLDLPPAIYQTRDVELSADQKKHYKEISRELMTNVGGMKVVAMNEGIKLSKLLQVACGVVYASDGTPQEIDCGSRVETLMEIIEGIDEKVIVFVPFTAVTGMLARELNKHWNFAVVTGDTSVKERNQIFSDFQNPDKDIDILAHPGTMSHGLTLTEASTIIWYAPIDSNDVYEQACGRITRPGQHFTANIVNLAGSAVERRMYKRLVERQKIQGSLLEMVERGESLI